MTVVDKSDFFRYWYTHPETWRTAVVLNHNGDKYLDIKGRMGTTYASLHSQTISFFMDWLYNNEAKDGSYSLTLMDDTICLNSSKDSYSAITSINKSLGFEINPKKSQINLPEVKWSGYLLNVKSRKISLPAHKLAKIKKKITDLLENEESTLRQYASFLSSCYSARLILFRQNTNLSTIVYNTRQHCRLDKWFYEKREMAKDKYDARIKANKSLDREMWLAFDIISQSCNFQDVHDNINCLSQPIPKTPTTPVNCDTITAFTDASDHKIGIFVMIDNKKWMLSSTFSKEIAEKTINYKELYAIAIALLFIRHILWKYKFNHKMVLIFVDNIGAKIIATTRRVKLKNLALYRLADFINHINLSFHDDQIQIQYEYINTLENKIADTLSRSWNVPNFSSYTTVLDKYLT